MPELLKSKPYAVPPRVVGEKFVCNHYDAHMEMGEDDVTYSPVFCETVGNVYICRGHIMCARCCRDTHFAIVTLRESHVVSDQ